MWLAIAGGALWALFSLANAAAYRWWPIASLESLGEGEGRIAKWADEIREWRWDREDVRAQARWEQIQQDLAVAEEPDWEGEYYSCYDGSLRFAIAPSGYAALITYGCGFGRIPRNFASHGELIRVTESSIFFREATPEFATSSDPLRDVELVRVRWGHRHYLIERQNFELMQSEGPASLRTHTVLMQCRRKDLHYPVDGLPDFPHEYRNLLPPPPIPLTIRESWCEELPSEYDNCRSFRVRSVVALPSLESPLEAGDGVFALFGTLPESTVLFVSGDAALIEYTEYVDKPDDPILPRPGWAFGIEQEPVNATE